MLVTEDASKRHPFPCPTTYRTALSHYLDITSIPRANVLKELAEYAEDDVEKQKLALMGSNTPEGKVRGGGAAEGWGVAVERCEKREVE